MQYSLSHKRWSAKTHSKFLFQGGRDEKSEGEVAFALSKVRITICLLLRYRSLSSQTKRGPFSMYTYLISVSWKNHPLVLDITHESLDQIENLQVHDCLQPTAGDHLCRRLLGHWAPAHLLSLNNHCVLMFFSSMCKQIIHILRISPSKCRPICQESCRR